MENLLTKCIYIYIHSLIVLYIYIVRYYIYNHLCFLNTKTKFDYIYTLFSSIKPTYKGSMNAFLKGSKISWENGENKIDKNNYSNYLTNNQLIKYDKIFVL